MVKLLRNCFFCISSSSRNSDAMARRPFILWLHGLGDSGPANENIKTVFKSPELSDAKWLFPSAPYNPVTCNQGRVMPSWFDVPELPFRAGSRIDETSILEAVKKVHAIIDQEIARGTRPENVFICGISQGGALTLASVLLYPKTLGGGAVLSGWVPLTSSMINQFPEEAKKTPILWSHGTDDELVLFEAGQAALPFLEKAGVTCEFKAYPGLAHWMNDEELQYIESWIKSRMQSSSIDIDMRTSTLTKPIVLFSISLLSTVLFFAFFFEDKPYSSSSSPSSSDSMARRTFILWLHGLGDSGPANEPIKTLFKSPEFSNTKWLFPSAPPNPVSCNHGMVMPSWFDIRELPLTAASPNDESSVLEAVKNVHAVIDKEIAGGIKPENVYICGFSQGGALTLASALLYPKTLGGGAVFSGWVPFNSSVINQFTKDAIKTPILWSHGIDDKTVLFEAGQAALPFLQQAGVTCEFKAYPDLGHSISNNELQYLESWIKQRMLSSSSSSS
ncbi:carboxylesterase [Raphanus sativus]|nr:carboxylesterase [Raphanus sativus]